MEEIFSYGMITTSTIMFGLMFFFSDMFRKNYGSGLQATMVTSIGGGIFGFIALFLIKVAPVGISTVFNEIISGFSPFVIIISLISIANGKLFTFCSLKALGKINLSLYALFSMLGGMVLPFVSGIFFHGEPLTLAKLVCFIIITIALCFTVQKDEKKSGTIYYIGVFILNGMSGVIAKIYQAMPYKKMDSAGYSLFKAFLGIIVAVIILMLIKKEKRKINFKCIVAMAGNGTLGTIGNWLLLLSLYTLPASVQYPFITGGTMIVSTVISFFTAKKPSKKEIVAVSLSFIGILLLIFIPEINIFTIKW